jgi:uncharacterized glyoxalase superfamily protein PhnB
MTVKPVPEGYHTITPYLVMPGLGKLIEFLKQAFDAEVIECMSGPDGSIAHAEARIGDSMVMMGEPRDERKPTPAAFYVYVPDCDAVYRKALAAGGESVSEPADMFYGDRHGGVRDPLGNTWWIATRKENLTKEEILERQAEFLKEQGGG